MLTVPNAAIVHGRIGITIASLEVAKGEIRTACAVNGSITGGEAPMVRATNRPTISTSSAAGYEHPKEDVYNDQFDQNCRRTHNHLVF